MRSKDNNPQKDLSPEVNSKMQLRDYTRRLLKRIKKWMWVMFPELNEVVNTHPNKSNHL